MHEITNKSERASQRGGHEFAPPRVQARRRHRIPSRVYLRRDIFLPRCPEFRYTFCNAITARDGATESRLGFYLRRDIFLSRCPIWGYTFLLPSQCSEKRTRSDSLRRVRRPRCPEYGYTFCYAITARDGGRETVWQLSAIRYFLLCCSELGYTW